MIRFYQTSPVHPVSESRGGGTLSVTEDKQKFLCLILDYCIRDLRVPGISGYNGWGCQPSSIAKRDIGPFPPTYIYPSKASSSQRGGQLSQVRQKVKVAESDNPEVTQFCKVAFILVCMVVDWSELFDGKNTSDNSYISHLTSIGKSVTLDMSLVLWHSQLEVFWLGACGHNRHRNPRYNNRNPTV